MVTFRPSVTMALTALASLLLATHVARADEETGTVKGKVMWKGAPLARGRIFFCQLDNDQFVGAKIKNGNYSVKKLPAGTYVIALEAAGLPTKYSDEHTSGLTCTIQKGSQTHDVDLR